MRHCRSRLACLFVAALIASVLVDCADAKKKKKDKKKKKKSGRSASFFSSSSASSSKPQSSTIGAAAVVSTASAYLTQCEAHKNQLEHFGKNCVEEHKKIVEKHNHIAHDYNELLHKHNLLIKKYNYLVIELDDPSIAKFLQAKAIKISRHPGIQGAVNKTKVKVLPVAAEVLDRGQKHSAQWLNKTKADIQHWLEEHGEEVIPESWVPSVSGFVVYGSVLIPVTIACWCVLEVVCNLTRLLTFGHVYLSVSGLCATVFSVLTGDDPVSTFAEHDPELYQFAQVSFGIIVILYSAVSFVALNCGRGDGCFRVAQLLVALSFAGAYYFLIWTPAMIDEEPKIEDLVDRVAPTAGKDADTPVLWVASPYFLMALTFTTLVMFEPAEPSSSVTPQDDEENEKDA
jgi:hypothetical protein